ncbi:MAG: FAD-dependent 5-carboxymethylaminomethyl-2-thiouridine(34) oxidoreductase MnmC [Alphaproteobacteria bacterium]|nr:FAD-dependent 5-carboxymethylaminomethyl-2-thiouridine(34) oxidoreductase MnmC [Alphaproteobacteria bacterium]
MRVAIIGGGLAGTACAYALKQAGYDSVIYEASDAIASGASGNKIGLYNPRFTAQKDENAKYFTAAFFEALALFEQAKEEIDWNPCGALFLMNDEKKIRRYPKTVESWDWPDNDMRLVSAKEATNIAGVEISEKALYLPRSGFISPAKLCAYYAKGIETRLGHKISALEDLEECDAIILACGMGAKSFYPDLPIKAVRGQVTYVRSKAPMNNLKSILSFGGYVTPEHGGVHCIGSTFQPWLDHSDILTGDDTLNIEKCLQAIPGLNGDYEVVDHRAAVRVASKDHMPIIGKKDELNGRIPIYLSLAHGSHGILSSFRSARLLVNELYPLFHL